MGGLRVLATYQRPNSKKRASESLEVPEARSTQYFAKKWEVSNSTVWRWTQLEEDPLPATKVEGVLRVDVKKALDWWDRHALKEGNR